MSFHFSNSGYNDSNFNKGLSLLTRMTSETTWVVQDVLLADKTTSTVPTTCARENERGTRCLSAGVRLALYVLKQSKDHTKEELKVLTILRQHTPLVPWTQQDGYLISGEKNHLGGDEKQNFQEHLLPRLKLILDRRQSDEGGADNGTLAQIGPFLDM